MSKCTIRLICKPHLLLALFVVVAVARGRCADEIDQPLGRKLHWGWGVVHGAAAHSWLPWTSSNPAASAAPEAAPAAALPASPAPPSTASSSPFTILPSPAATETNATPSQAAAAASAAPQQDSTKQSPDTQTPRGSPSSGASSTPGPPPAATPTAAAEKTQENLPAFSPSAAQSASPSPSSTPSPQAEGLEEKPGQPTATAAAQKAANPCLFPGGTELLTVQSRCREDEFNIAILEFSPQWTWQGEAYGPEQFTNVYTTNGWATIRGTTDNQFIRPRPDGSNSSSSSDGSSNGQYVAVLRVRDGKWVVPKGLDLSGRSSSSDLVDIQNSKLSGCVLVGDTEDRPFPRFRLVVKADSNRVLADSVAAPGVSIFKGQEGIACEDVEERVLGFAGATDPTRGKLVDFYKPSSCKFVIDDCSG